MICLRAVFVDGKGSHINSSPTDQWLYTEMTKNLAGGGNLPYVEVCKCAEQNGREECVYGTLRSTVSVYRILFLFIFATKFF